MDKIIEVDKSLCIGCDACIRCCPGGLIVSDKFPVPSEDSWEFCIDWMKSTKDTNPGLYHEAKLGMFVDHWEAGRTNSIRYILVGLPDRVLSSHPEEEACRCDLGLKTCPISLMAWKMMFTDSSCRYPAFIT